MNSLKLGLLAATTAVSFGFINYSASIAKVSTVQNTQSSSEVSSLKDKAIVSQQVAFNLPNFKPEASMNGNTLQVSIPVSLFEGPINDILRANEGSYKDTAFQKMDVSNLRVAFTNGGFTVNGNWRVQAREYLGSILGKKKYSPWVSVSGSLSQGFNVKVSNGKLVAEAGKTDIRGASKWYGDIVDAVISRMKVNGQVNKQVNSGLQSINGMNVQQLLVSAGSAQVAQALQISPSDASKLINSRVGGINATISNGRLQISVAVR
ncbi:hypothetical protein [Oscillatoria sp. FACHB-1406]|uniref:hypothetical protein n=1 Tax=Oscillatoria sp. FACHB-1406 TaxID=2692846 RepID=UPI0016875B1D|nr:hypothetical protein [Oscillatoria sp. FACHB-1406]MBD2580515.1 hypothetical protein [Oscillatoria sp. FACHB-1406]